MMERMIRTEFWIEIFILWATISLSLYMLKLTIKKAILEADEVVQTRRTP
jgi:hypothetical protein